MSDLPIYSIDRVFNAPREMVWRAWTDPELLSRWYGPGADTIIHSFDLTEGGIWLNEMKWGDKSHFQKVIFKEVITAEKMVWHHYSSTDSNGESITNPMMPDWPKLLLTTIIFEQEGDKTNVRLTQIPLNATASEIACFAKVMGNMDSGWGSGYAIMDDIFAELQAKT